MPRVKELIPTDKAGAVLGYCTDYKNWDDQRLEKELNIGKSARLARQKDISKYSLGEIRKIIRGVPISPAMAEILFGITWDTSDLEMKIKGLL